MKLSTISNNAICCASVVFAILVVFACCGAVTAGDMIPAKGGELSAIVIGASPNVVEQSEAKDLQHIFLAITGKNIEILSKAANGRCVYIGCAPDGEDLNSKLNRLGKEGIYLSVSPKRIICAGHDPRGTYYAVQELLYRIGCRWIWPGQYGECLPAGGPIALPAKLELLHTPAFSMRGGHSIQVEAKPGGKPEHVDVGPYVEWAARNKWNRFKASYSLTWSYGEERGGEWEETSGHTTTTDLMPASLFDKHPEYFALVKGKRVALHPIGTTAMPCISNPAVIDRFTDVIMAYFDAHPNASRYFIGANDEPSYWCECDGCRALDTVPMDLAKNGVECGNMTDRWLYLVNAVAERIEKKYPGKWIGTFAYGSTRSIPTKNLPRKNVMIEYTMWNHCAKHKFFDSKCPVNKEGLGDLKKWKAVASAVSIYSYLDHGAWEIPEPYWESDQDYYRSLHKMGIRFISDEIDTSAAASPVLLGYRIRLLWDLKTDAKQYLKEICQIAYGNAAPEMQEFWALQQAAVYASPTKHPTQNDMARYTPAMVAQSYKLIDAAAAKQLTTDQKARVEKTRMSMLFVDYYQAKEASASGELKVLAKMSNSKAAIYKLSHQYGFPINYGAWGPLGAEEANAATDAINGKLFVTIPEDWLFRLDPNEVGETEKWFMPGTDLSAYKPLSTTKNWEAQWVGTYDGSGWYVMDIAIPATDAKHVWLLFGAVDDSWKAWLNGDYIGASVGEPGDIWDKPAAIDITGKYKPGEKVHIVLKVHDMAGQGGLWRPAMITTSD